MFVTAGALALHIVMVSSALMILFPWSKWFSGADKPAWVQAVGSIIAILVAVALPAWQHHAAQRAAEDERRAEAARLSTIAMTLCYAVFAYAVKTGRTRSDPLHVELQQEREVQAQALSDMMEALRSFPLASLPSANLVRIVTTILSGAAALHRFTRPGQPEPIRGSASRALPWISSIESMITLIEWGISEVHALDPTIAIDGVYLDEAKALVRKHALELAEAKKSFAEMQRPTA